MKSYSALTAVFLVSLASVPALAGGVARHERVEVKPITKDKQVVGVRIKLTVQPEQYSKVRIGIGKAGQIPEGNNYQPAASDVSAGHLFHQFDEISVAPNKPHQVELKVLYKDNPKLTPGQSFEIVSAFPNGSSGWHVFGMTRRAQNATSYTLPGKKASQRKSKLGDIRRAGKRISRRNLRRRPVRQTARKPAARAKKAAPRARR